MDIQKMLDAVLTSHRHARSQYHVTLGKLTKALEESAPGREVKADTGAGLGREHSYRGHYDDLSFEPGPVTTAGELLAVCKRAALETYTGYKGGDFTYAPDTPLWLANYGTCGLALVGIRTDADGALILETKDTDE